VGWHPRGLIFDVRDWDHAPAVGSFAQSPQALVLENSVRVYFSTRTPDGDAGSWRSDVAFAEFSLDFSELVAEPRGDVISPGELGCFDEHGIFPFSVVPVDEEVWAYTTGWSRRRSVPVETGIGLAVSRDGGRTFERRGPGPVLSSSLHEPFLVGDGFARRVDGRWLMWYLFGTGWTSEPTTGNVERTYKIGVATSPNGIDWTPAQGRCAIQDRLGPSESQALPSVFDMDGELHMVFCYRESFDFRTNPERGYRLGHAVSRDGLAWSRDDAPVEFPRLEFDSDMRCYPNLVTVGDRRFLLYNGNEFGRWGFGVAEWTT
jgi:hypothetical protein